MEEDDVRKERCQYILEFSLEIPFLENKTLIHKEFNNWTDSELGNIVQEIRYCLVGCGYAMESVDKYIPSTL